jgi:uncharacterized membrane protein (DUF485 family)
MSSSDNEKVWVETQASPEFQALKKSFRRFAFPLTVGFLVWYLTYVALTAFAREFVATTIGDSNINLAFVLGVLQFVSTFLIMWLYERHSSKKLDPASEAIRLKVEKELTK